MPSWAVDWSNSDYFSHQRLQHHYPGPPSTGRRRAAFSNNLRTLNTYGRDIESIGTVEQVGLPLSRRLRNKLLEEDDENVAISKYLSSPEGSADILALRSWINVSLQALQSLMTTNKIMEEIAKTLHPLREKYDELYGWLRMIATNISPSGSSTDELDEELQSEVVSGLEDKLRSELFPSHTGPVSELPIHLKILINILRDNNEGRKIIAQHAGIVRHLRGQVFFVTSKGIMGTGNEDSQKGDQVMAFEHSNFFMLVHNDGSKNTFVGPARIPSIDIVGILRDEARLERIEID
ncbi:hypothetical protein GQ44DRAFT_767117 [Phaeosphaeriaceae sp. PMI808]|nr:hypothetical protein GQ44DRAFT_767117 [Phaeosphaeriaceae sp. PMI808]